MTQSISMRTLLEAASEVADLAGATALRRFHEGFKVETKADGSPVTDADREAERVARAWLEERFPADGILGEEFGESRPEAFRRWVVDPIDGTKSFILGQLHWATLIALHDGERVVAGVAHQPYVGESFVATVDGTAQWRRGGERRNLRTRPCGRLGDAVLACTHPSMFRTPPERAAFDRVADRARLTRWGGDCYAYCLLAMGLIDIVIESSLQAYDVQALIPIVTAAGGVMTSWTGGGCDEGGSVVACGDRVLHGEVLKLLA